MSAIAEAARVNLLLADYAAVDGTNKVNILGANWQVTGINPSSGLTAAQSVILLIDVPPQYYDEQFAVETTLYNEANEIVEAPGPTGQPAPLRISQLVKAEVPVVAGHFVPPKALWAKIQTIINLPNGILVKAGETYEWRVRIDGDDSRIWSTTFHVAGPPPQPLIG